MTAHPPLRVRDLVAVFALAFGLLLVRLDHTPQWDEFYHVLAAQSLVRDGTLAIADGSYTRGALFTRMVSLFVGLWPESLVAARMPSVLAGAGLAAGLFGLIAAHAGRVAALWAVLLLVSNPLHIEMAQQARFYSVHALLVLGCVWSTFELVLRPGSLARRIALGAVALVLAAMAAHLQITTLIALAALGTWFALRTGPQLLRGLLSRPRGGWWLAALAMATLAVAAAVLTTDFAARALRIFGSTPYWGRETAGDRRFYDRSLGASYPTLWTAFPIAAMFALRRSRDLAGLALCVFGVGFLVHSVAATKGDRYLFWALPFFFALWGVALAECLPRLRQLAGDALVALAPWLRGRVVKLASAAAVLAIVAFAALTNPAYRYAFLMLAVSDADWEHPHVYRGYADWEAAAPALRPLLDQADVLVSAAGVKSLYYLKRVDYDLSRTVLAETESQQEFGMDPRTGRPVISRPESLARIMALHPRGLVIVEAPRWRIEYSIPNATADFIEANMERVPLDDDWRLLAFRWPRGEPAHPVAHER